MSQAVRQVTDSALMKRYGTIEEQVAPILFLASDEASYITGDVLPVAGGDLGETACGGVLRCLRTRDEICVTSIALGMAVVP